MALPPNYYQKIPVNMLRNCTYLFCCLALLFGSHVLRAQDNNSCLSFQLEDISTNANSQFCIDLTTQGFQNVLGMQGSILYDPEILQFIEVQDFGLPGLSAASFGTPAVGPEKTVTFSWSSPTATGVNLADGQTMTKLCFQPLVDSGKTIVEFSKQPTPIELIDGNLRLLSATFLAAEVQIGGTEASDLQIDELCVLPSICGEIGRGFIEVQASAGVEPLAYSWTGPNGFSSNASSFEATAGGYYELELSNVDGEIAKACAVVVGGNGESIVAANITPVPCDQEEGGAIELTLSSSNTDLDFIWDNGATGSSLTNLAAGTYSVTITDLATECSIVQHFDVPKEGIRGSLFSKCLSDEEVELWALIFDVEGNPHTYDWSNGETFTGPNEHKIVVPAGTGTEYMVTVTNNQGCSTVLQTVLPSCEVPSEGEDDFDGCLILEAEEMQGEEGEVVCLDFTVQDFENILGLQFTIEFDQSLLGFVEARNFALASSTTSFGVLPELLADGHVTLAWSDSQLQPRTLEDNAVVFTLCFEVLGDAGFASVIVNGSRTPMEAIWARNPFENVQTVSLGSIGGGIQIGEPVSAKPIIEQICAEALGCGSTVTTHLIAAISGDMGPFSYNWEGPEGYSSSELTPEVTSPGLYSMTLTDAAGATAVAAIQVEESRNVLDLNANIVPVSCAGTNDGSISLDNLPNGSNYTYEWSNGASTREISDLEVGEYTVSVTDNSTGCQTIKRFQLDRDGIAASLYYNCLADSMVEVTAVIFNPQGFNYTFHWSNGVQQSSGSQSTVLISALDSISVEITSDIGCEYVSPLLRPVCSDQPPLNFVSATYAYTCAPDNQNATITTYVLDNGNGPYTFSWSAGFVETNVTQSTLTVPASGSYQITVADALGNTQVLGGIEPNCGVQNVPPLQLSIGEANANTGESVCLAVRAKNFINIAGLQYAVAWDAEKLALNSIQNYSLPHLSDINFNFQGPNYQNGLLRMSWADLMGLGVSMPDDGILYEMCFTVTGSGGEVPVFFDVASMQMEFVNEDLQAGIPVLDDGLIIINGEERMWPGDTDHNEVANHFDLLNLGLAYGATGPTRENANLIWQGQWAADWGQGTPSTGVDYKHIDTNGDGEINIADTTAISLNWGRAVNLSPNPMAEYRSSPEDLDMQGAPIYVEAYPVRPGETVSFDINLGDNENPVEGAYGLAFSIVYDPLAVAYGSAKATFQNSWLGNLDQDMIALARDDPNNHRLHIGITRIDQLEVNGNGAIGQISMTIEDVIFRDGEYEMPFRVENIRLIRSSEAEIEVQQKQTIGTVTETPLSTGEEPLLEQVKLFPNPTANLINIQYRSTKIERIQLLNLGGQLLREYKAMDQISLQGFAPSTYILRFVGLDGVFLKKVIKQ